MPLVKSVNSRLHGVQYCVIFFHKQAITEKCPASNYGKEWGDWWWLTDPSIAPTAYSLGKAGAAYSTVVQGRIQLLNSFSTIKNKEDIELV